MNEGLDSGDHAESIAGQRVSCGVLLLSPTMRLIHMNRQAGELAKRIEPVTNGNAARGVLPTALTQLGAEIQKRLQSRTEDEDWDQFELRRLAGTPQRPVLLRGFGLPDRNDRHQSRILIIMEEVGRQKEGVTEHPKKRFQLTDRQWAVVDSLLKGLTNKEIAAALEIAEQTVKEHLTCIMKKTNSTTRTGILIQVFLS